MEKGDFEAVAALIGSTSAGLKQVEGNIIDGSTNLQAKWDPKEVLKGHVLQNQEMAPQGASPPPPPPSVPPAGVHPEIQLHPMPDGSQPTVAPQMQPPPQVYSAQPPSTELIEKLDRIEKKLDILLGDVRSLNSLDEKISKNVEKGLQGKMKQITIKLDDTTTKK